MSSNNTLFDEVFNGLRFIIQLVIVPDKFLAEERYSIDGKEYPKELWTERFHQAREEELRQSDA